MQIVIYKFTSPTNKIYVGQSWNFKNRVRYYKSLNCKEQPGIYRSLVKHGFENHSLEIMAEYPDSITQQELNDAEIFYIAKYKSEGFKMLNMNDGGNNAKHSEESKAKMREKRKGHKPTLGKKFSDEARAKMSAWQKGRKMPKDYVIKMTARMQGTRPPELAFIKLAERRAQGNWWNGRKHNEESKQKQSIAKLGHKINNKKVKRIDTGEVFGSLTDAANSIGVQMKTLSARITNGCKKEPRFTYDI